MYMAWNNLILDDKYFKDILVVSVDQSLKSDIYLSALRMSVHEHATSKSLDGLGITIIAIYKMKTFLCVNPFLMRGRAVIHLSMRLGCSTWHLKGSR